MIKQTLINLLIFIAIQTICLQLLFDPWSQERFERMFRENARLFNPLLHLVPRIDHLREFLAVFGIVVSFLHFLGSKYFGQVSFVVVFMYWLVYYNFQILLSERFWYLVVPVSSGLVVFCQTIKNY